MNEATRTGALYTPSVNGETIFVGPEEHSEKKKWCDFCRTATAGSKYALGIFLILCVTVIWVLSSAWIQHIFQDLDYNKPYFLTFFNTTGFNIWNLGFLLVPSWSRVPYSDESREQPIIVEDPRIAHDGWHEVEEREREQHYRLEEQAYKSFSPQGVAQREAPIHSSVLDELWGDSLPSSCTGSSVEDFYDVPSGDALLQRVRVERVRTYSLKKIWCAAALFCPFWFFANYLFNVSLSTTSIASNTILSSTSSIWTLLLSYVMLRQPVGLLRWVGVALCFSGGVMVGASQSGGTQTFGGDVAALVSAFFYATYTTILKWQLPDDDRYSMGMVFGAVGVFNLLFFWPGLVLLDIIKWESFMWPTVDQLWPLVLNSLIGTNLSDVLWARSVVLTSPVVVTLGMSLTIPLAMIVDAVLSSKHYSGTYIAGAVLVLCGFLCANVPLEIDVLGLLKRLKFW